MELTTAHPFVAVPGIADEIDVEVAELVRLLNTIPGVYTASSCQGDPGELDGEHGHMGHVCIKRKSEKNWRPISQLMFEEILPLISHLEDDVDVSVTHPGYYQPGTENTWFNGWLHFRNESLPAVTEAIRKRLEKRNCITTKEVVDESRRDS